MKLKKEYTDIIDTMHYIKVQIKDSIPYARRKCPKFKTPEDLFYWLKDNTYYKNDPQNIELLQSMQTLFEDNYHDIKGAGDCDCFVITSCACFIRNGWKFKICLVGREKKAPVHIYTLVNFKGKEIPFDLTNAHYGEERPYKYIQEIPIKIR
jgi:hypothetical protein